MRFAVTPDQASLRAAVRDLLDAEATPEALRAAWDSDTGRVPGLWQRLADFGATGLTVAEEHGGLGLTAIELAGVFAELGRHAAAEPLLGSYVAGDLLAGTELGKDWLPQIADGSAMVAVGAPGAAFVADAQGADLVLLPAGDDMLALTVGDVAVTSEPGADTGLRLATVVANGGGTRLPAAAERARALGAFGTAAQLVGVADGLLAQAVRHALVREQFGRPIGSFQAVKHGLADVYVAVAFARPVVLNAAYSLATDAATAARDSSHAKCAAVRAARLATRTALQVHGAIGYTYEHDLHMWLKRAWTLTTLWGDDAHHRARVANAVLP